MVTITVTAEDTVSTRVYRVSVNRGVTAGTGWQAGADLDGLVAADNGDPIRGIWSNRVYRVGGGPSRPRQALRLQHYRRDAGRRPRTSTHCPGTASLIPTGIWSNGDDHVGGGQ